MKSTPDGYICLIHKGTLDIIYALCVAASDNNVTQAQGTVSAIQDVIHYLKHGQLPHLKIGVDDTQAVIQDEAWQLHFSIMTFIIAHEVAHIVLGHLNQSSKHLIQFLQNDLKDRRNQELEADKLATELLLLIEQKKLSPLNVTCGSINFFLAYQIMASVSQKLTRIGQTFNVMLQSDSHPPPEERITAITAVLKQQSPATFTTVRNKTLALRRLLTAADSGHIYSLKNQCYQVDVVCEF